MPRFAHADVLDPSLAYIKANCDKLVILSSYTDGASYSDVMAAMLAEVDMTPDDMVISNGADGARQLVTATGKIDPSANASGSGTGMHVGFLDAGATKVLFVTPAPADKTINAGEPVAFAPVTITLPQPTV